MTRSSASERKLTEVAIPCKIKKEDQGEELERREGEEQCQTRSRAAATQGSRSCPSLLRIPTESKLRLALSLSKGKGRDSHSAGEIGPRERHSHVRQRSEGRSRRVQLRGRRVQVRRVDSKLVDWIDLLDDP